MNNQPTETDPYIFITDLTGDIFLPSADSALLRLSGYNEELYAAAMNFYNLYDSKEAFFQGTERMNKSDFQGAADLLEKVIEEDSWYSEAQNKLTEAQLKLMEEKAKLIEKFISEGRYEAAQDEITKLRNKNPTKEISEKLDTYETKIYEAKLAKIDEFVNSGDIDAANEYIESLGDGLSAEAKERLKQAIKNKAFNYIAKADEALKSGEREGAYDMAKMAQSLCPNDNEINKKVEYFKAYLPFKLYNEKNMLKTSGQGSIWGTDFSTVSNNNKQFNHTFQISWGHYGQNAPGGNFFNTEYNLAKKYNEVSGTIFIASKDKNDPQTSYFKAYGDGKLIYTSPNIKPGVLPQNFNFNVSDIDILKIEFYGQYDDTWVTTFSIDNFVATKDLP